MSSTNSSSDGIVGTSFMSTSLPLCTMSTTHSSSSSLICTSFMSTTLYLGTMTDTDSSLDYNIGTSFVFTLLPLGSMPPTYFSSHSNISTSLMTSLLTTSSVSFANTSFNDIIGASIDRAFTPNTFCRNTGRWRHLSFEFGILWWWSVRFWLFYSLGLLSKFLRRTARLIYYGTQLLISSLL